MGPSLLQKSFSLFFAGVELSIVWAPVFILRRTNLQSEWFSPLWKMEDQSGSFHLKLLRFLLSYRNTPHASTGRSPASIMFGRALRTRLDLLLPKLPAIEKEEVSARYEVGQPVLARDYRPRQPKWQAGSIEKRLGSYLYGVRVGNLLIKRHVDQLLPASTTPDTVPTSAPEPLPILEEPDPQPASSSSDTTKSIGISEVSLDPIAQTPQEPVPVILTPVLRRSSRVSRPPDRLMLQP